jgi:25S rRNA (adenine2142-N1)-methyltransferase
MTSKVKSKNIARGRPPLAKSRPASLSSRTTRSIIRSHHSLCKQHTKALAENDEEKAKEIRDRIAKQGGLDLYQLASTAGQSLIRGGDSSRVLVEWLSPLFNGATVSSKRFRMLEVGALSTTNACSLIECLDVDRVDLRSREKGIQEIDFMELPVPENNEFKYDVLSLSLVLNFVPEPVMRGEMLSRTTRFLRRSLNQTSLYVPSLFLVLPLPCLANSRYLSEEKLQEIMESLGYRLTRVKKTTKVYYSLWTLEDTFSGKRFQFRKDEVRSGASRNNFAIVLQ